MQLWNHYLAGVEDVWCCLVGCVFVLVLLTARLVRSYRSRTVMSLAGDQTGAAYMLPLVLTMPFYVLLITLIIECTLMLTAKIGSVGAAYAAARAAAVWLPYETAMPKDAPDYTPLEKRMSMVHLAAARAMFPYASGSESHAANAPLDELLKATAQQQIAAFQAYAGNQSLDVAYLKRKFAYACNASSIDIQYLHPDSGAVYEKQDTPAFNAKIQLTLNYEAPIHTYGIGRLFGQRSQFGNHFVRRVVTSVMIENEGVKAAKPMNERSTAKGGKSLGIKYYALTEIRPVQPAHARPRPTATAVTGPEEAPQIPSQSPSPVPAPTPYASLIPVPVSPTDLHSIDDRRDAYAVHQIRLSEAGGLASQIRFPTAARNVSEELDGFFQIFYFLLSSATRSHLASTNARLYEFNHSIFEQIRKNPSSLFNPIGKLPAPLINPEDDLRTPTTGFDFDLQMVIAEQRLVSAMNSQLGEARSEVITRLNNVFDTNLVEDLGHSISYGTPYNSWAREAINGPIDFDNEAHRIAIGHAAIFAEHGYSREQYLDFKLHGKMP